MSSDPQKKQEETAFDSMEHFMTVMSQCLKIMAEGKPTTKVHMQFKCLEKEVTLEFRMSTPAEIENHSDGSTMIVTDPNLPEGMQDMINKAESGELTEEVPAAKPSDKFTKDEQAVIDEVEGKRP